MKFIRNIVIFTLAAMMTLSAQVKPSMTLQRAMATALEKNFNVISAQNTYESHQGSVTAAYGRLLPSVSAYGSRDRYQYWQQAAPGDLVFAKLNDNKTLGQAQLRTSVRQQKTNVSL